MKKMFITPVALLAATLLCLAGCTSSPAREAGTKATHVVLIGLDGWGAYSLPKADMPHLKSLITEGAYTLKKRSTLPSSSAINWASMFMGAGPELHGYTLWNSQTPEIPSRVTGEHGIFPTIFTILREARPQAEIGCLHEWDGIKYLVDTLALSYRWEAPADERYTDALCTQAEQYIKEKRPTFVAVCFDNPDHVGHTAGHDTPLYYASLAELDSYIGRIVEAVRQAGMLSETIFIVTSDHGGIDKGHGGKTLQEMETPLIISGANVRAGVCFDEVSTMQFDVASTIAYIFGLQQPQAWIGRPLTTIFKP
jgi:predicted AlkP superfamily pyrophosphatase or phosphodiesterase